MTYVDEFKVVSELAQRNFRNASRRVLIISPWILDLYGATTFIRRESDNGVGMTHGITVLCHDLVVSGTGA
jgi:hypothetical protein